MNVLLLSVFSALLTTSPVHPADIEVQTSWHDGPGEQGPVLHWGERFHDSDSVAYWIPGKLLLAASRIDHNAWVRHAIELNPNLEAHANILPVDLNKDGYLDLVAIVGGAENQVVWYERTATSAGKGYTKHVVGDFRAGQRATTWPWDMDGDGDVDIVASGDEGLAWFENGNLSFTKHSVELYPPYLYARPGDVDNDGDVDIVVHDKSGSEIAGDMWLFRNDGTMTFSRELIYDVTGRDIWRINFADFNGDGFLDIQTSYEPVRVFLNDRLGNFTLAYLNRAHRTDGSWPADVDADGDADIVLGAYNYLFWLENDGTGMNFTEHWIGSGPYGDGTMAADVNLDGLMDALGSYDYVGWFEQLESGNFVEHRLPNGTFYDSHWVYGENLDGDPCTGDVDIDILAAKNGEFAWWENRSISFAAHAWLESSILDASEAVSWVTFGWDDHVPSGNELRYRVRSGGTVAELLANPWSSPILFSGDTLSKYGVSPGQYFQYRIEFERTTGAPDRSPTVYEVIVAIEELGSIFGGKFYDTDVDGVWDAGEVGLEEWLILLESSNRDRSYPHIGMVSETDDKPRSYFSGRACRRPVRQAVYSLSVDSTYTDTGGYYGFLDLEPGAYRVSEVIPDPQPTWVPTTPTEYSVTVEPGQNVTGIDFGNVVLGEIGARTIGYWKNHLERITPGMYAALDTLPAFAGCGSPDSVLAILTPSWSDMAAKVRAQLLAMTLNVLSGIVAGDAVVYLGWDVLAAELLFGVPAPSFKRAQEVLDVVELAWDWGQWTRSEQEAVKDLLDRMNNDLLFVLPGPPSSDRSLPALPGGTCSVGRYEARPSAHGLFQNVPNPFSSSTLIRFQLPTRGHVSLSVYDLSGRLVRTLVDEQQERGVYSANWDGKDGAGRPVSQGIYLYRLDAGYLSATRKMVVVR